MNTKNTIVIASLLSTVFLAGCAGISHQAHDGGHHAMSRVGEPGTGAPDRQVSVSMQDNMRFVFNPGLDTLVDGETIEFIVSNDGVLPHEFSIGDAQDQIDHAEEMKQMSSMSHDGSAMKHRDPNTVSLASGETASLMWKFKGADATVVFACNVPGHFEAGMHHRLAIER